MCLLHLATLSNEAAFKLILGTLRDNEKQKPAKMVIVVTRFLREPHLIIET